MYISVSIYKLTFIVIKDPGLDWIDPNQTESAVHCTGSSQDRRDVGLWAGILILNLILLRQKLTLNIQNNDIIIILFLVAKSEKWPVVL